MRIVICEVLHNFRSSSFCSFINCRFCSSRNLIASPTFSGVNTSVSSKKEAEEDEDEEEEDEDDDKDEEEQEEEEVDDCSILIPSPWRKKKEK